MHGRNGAGTWAQFTYTVPPQRSGSYELWARATDRGRANAADPTPFNTLGYLFDAVARQSVVLS